jgi:NAD(P)-dependent dehydrogenase (short-subunit alcohol dehydrogenase family)
LTESNTPASGDSKSNEDSPAVLITGVSSGLGHALASRYLDEGWLVFGISRRVPEDLRSRLGFRFASADLTVEDQVDAALAELLPESTVVDLAILNAGQLGELGNMVDVTLTAMRKVMDVNVWANKILLDRLLVDRSVRRQVVTISSGASVNGNRGFAGYSISKAALNMMTRLYAREFPDVHFCALAPGVFTTAMQEEIGRKAKEGFEAFRALSERRERGEMPSPQEAAKTLFGAIGKLSELVDSGDYADIREERFHGAYSRR